MKPLTIIPVLCCLMWLTCHAQQPDYETGRVAKQPTKGAVTKDRNSKMSAALHGIYIHDDVLYFQIGLHNGSHIRFDIDFIRFYIRDRKVAKRTVTQEKEMMPLDIDGLERPLVDGKCGKTVVAALDKFTLADSKQLIIEIYEKDGGRHLYLKVRNRHIENAKPIN